jgi:hypothetical protein
MTLRSSIANSLRRVRTGRRIGQFAVIADPLGAAFAVLEGETDP